MGSLGVDGDVDARGVTASLMARRVMFPAPFMTVAKTDARGGGLSSLGAREERD